MENRDPFKRNYVKPYFRNTLASAGVLEEVCAIAQGMCGIILGESFRGDTKPSQVWALALLMLTSLYIKLPQSPSFGIQDCMAPLNF